VEYINKNFGTSFTDEDKVQHFAKDSRYGAGQSAPCARLCKLQ